ncbi:chitinase [uncultured Rothia sp.]|jgi:predicted  nucleic acid-binding Zn-ribbon protein|uniref:chitinase n=1 Tax=uncultured Rothia sp. TaxID=316088 RepID=UPI0025DF7A67|nr:chitinase [uncultured Rothia sp.]
MTNHTTARQRLLRFPLILGVTTALIFSSCSTGTNNNSAPSDKGTVTSQSPRQVENATNVLQNVNIQMGRDGEVSSIESTNIYVNDKDRTSSSSNVQFKPKDVVNDLPVRVSLQYSTERGSGTNLNDLNGYSGEITIKVTVENLTVKTEDVTYDASGTSRTSPAPVGTPFSIAASTVLSGSPTQVITTPDAADSSTNGVVSTNDEGKAVVQWGAISAPPVTGSSSSFVLKVKAKDFSAPTFNISVQPGFASDLSGAGIITNGFTSQDASQVALLQRTIDTVNEVNTTLTSASSQVAQVRQSLDDTSATLGKDTAEHLKTQNESLTKTMQGLQANIESLQKDLSEASRTNNSQLISQLERTVAALHSMLGDTTARPNVSVSHSGGRCVVHREEGASSRSVYGNLVQLSAVLNAYAEASSDCQQDLTASIREIVGPEHPTAETCSSNGSVTCALFGASVTVQSSLIALVATGEKIVDHLQPEYLKGANTNYSALKRQMDELVEQVEKDPSSLDADAVRSLREKVSAARQNVNQMKETSSRLIESIKNVHSRAASARAELVDGSGSMSAQNKELAEQLCALSTERGGSLSAEQVEHLRGYLTASSCGGAASPSASPSSEVPSEAPSPAPSESASATPSEEPSKKIEVPSAAPSSEASSAEPTATEGNTRVITVENANERTYTSNTPAARTPMEQRIAAAVAAWDEVLAATSMDDPKEGLARDAKNLNDAVNAVDGALGEVEKTLNDAVNAQNQDAEKKAEPTEEAKVSLRDRIHSASDAVNALGKNLEDMTNMQADLSTAIKEAFKESANETRESLTSMISEEIRKVSSDGSSSASAAKEAFSASVAGITDTANTVVQVAGESIEVQHKDMNDRIEGLRQSLDSVTERSLVALSTRAENATRDLAGASVQLNNDLSKLMLDLGDSNAEGAGLLGALKSNSAKAGAADYQLALAMQNAQGYTNLRSEDIAALQKRQAQFKASLQRLRSLPTFHLSNAGSAEVKTVYTFQIGD